MGTGLSAPWRKKTGLSRIRAWHGEGLTHKEIAGRMGIAVRTLTGWKGRYPEIGAALTGGEAAAEQAVSGKTPAGTAAAKKRSKRTPAKGVQCSEAAAEAAAGIADSSTGLAAGGKTPAGTATARKRQQAAAGEQRKRANGEAIQQSKKRKPSAAAATLAAATSAAVAATTPAAAEVSTSPAAAVTAEASAAATSVSASASAASAAECRSPSAPVAGKPLISLELLPVNADVHTLARDAGLLPLAPSADDKQLQSLVESALLRRALGYRYATVTQELRKDPVTGDMVMTVTKRIDKEVPPDTTAQLYWLKSRDPDRWRDKHPDEPAGDGEVIVTFDVDEEEPQEDDEDWDGDE